MTKENTNGDYYVIYNGGVSLDLGGVHEYSTMGNGLDTRQKTDGL